MSEDDVKDEALRLLYEPLFNLATLFGNAFTKQGYVSELAVCSWDTGIAQLTFEYQVPSSDVLRHTIFSIYDKVWGGKPAGLNCVYKAARDTAARSLTTIGVLLYITTDAKRVTFLLDEDSKGKVYAMDQADFNDWKSSNNHRLLKRAAPCATKRAYALPEPGSPEWRADEPIPTFEVGLFSV